MAINTIGQQTAVTSVIGFTSGGIDYNDTLIIQENGVKIFAAKTTLPAAFSSAGAGHNFYERYESGANNPAGAGFNAANKTIQLGDGGNAGAGVTNGGNAGTLTFAAGIPGAGFGGGSAGAPGSVSLQCCIDYQNITAPPVSAVGTARMYYDLGTNKLLLSENGGAFGTLGGISGSGILGQVTYWSGPAALTGNTNFTYVNNNLTLSTNTIYAGGRISNTAPAVPLASAVLADHTTDGTYVTITTQAAHGFFPSQVVTLGKYFGVGTDWTWVSVPASISPLPINNTFSIYDCPSATTFRIGCTNLTGNATVVGTITPVAQTSIGPWVSSASPYNNVINTSNMALQRNTFGALKKPSTGTYEVTTWTTRTSAVETSGWRSVCWSPELGIFVAVAQSGAGNLVMTSPDGITWTARVASSAFAWVSVCWSPEKAIFVAVAASGAGSRTMSSPDGVTWTGHNSANDAVAWSSVCWSSGKSLFVAVSSDLTVNGAMTSPDGLTWTSRTTPNNGWNSICWSPEKSVFVAVSGAGVNRVITSPDGITWTGRVSSNEGNNWYSVCWSPEKSIFVATSLDNVDSAMTSPDGISWTARTCTNQGYCVCWSPEKSIFVSLSGADANRVSTSPDGINWTVRTFAVASHWTSICWSPERSIFVGVSRDGTNRVMTSCTNTVSLFGNIECDVNALAAATADGVALCNTTVATVGTQQVSPRLRLGGHVWDTGADKTSDWAIWNVPTGGGAGASYSMLYFGHSLAGAAYDTGVYMVSKSTASQYGLYVTYPQSYNGSGYNASIYAISDNDAATGDTLFPAQTNPPALSCAILGMKRQNSNYVSAGIIGCAYGGLELTVGVYGLVNTDKNSGHNVGVMGVGINGGTSPVQVGGWFTLGQTVIPTVSAALICDNFTATDAIFLARNNNVTAFQILNGGAVKSGGLISAYVPTAIGANANNKRQCDGAGTATFTTYVAHGFLTGETVTVALCTDATYNGAYLITATPTTTTFTVASAHAIEGLTADAAVTFTINPVLRLGATPTVPDSLADIIIGASATTQKALVLQMKSAQTANAFEIQNSAGTIISSFSNIGGLLTSYVVQQITAGVGTPNILTSPQSRKVITNEGAPGALVYNTLPTAVAGLVFKFACQDVDGIVITASGGDTIRIGVNVSAAAGYIKSVEIGAYIELVAINATEWYAGSVIGTWTIDV